MTTPASETRPLYTRPDWRPGFAHEVEPGMTVVRIDMEDDEITVEVIDRSSSSSGLFVHLVGTTVGGRLTGRTWATTIPIAIRVEPSGEAP